MTSTEKVTDSTTKDVLVVLESEDAPTEIPTRLATPEEKERFKRNRAKREALRAGNKQ